MRYSILGAMDGKVVCIKGRDDRFIDTLPGPLIPLRVEGVHELEQSLGANLQATSSALWEFQGSAW